LDEAIEEFHWAIRLKPRNPAAECNLAVVLAARNRLPEAKVHYRRALALDPAFVRAHLELGRLLLRQGQPDAALAQYQQASKLCHGKSPEVLRSLAAAQAETGQFSEAVATARAALVLARQQHKGPLAANLEADIDHFEARQPRPGP
jgi:Flp pilus assembly protein TadD